MRKYRLRNIYFYLTEGCNLKCRHCWIAPKYQSGKKTYRSLEFEILRSILEQAKPLGLVSVKLTGGEPLLHPRIKDILKLIRTMDISLGIETNGTLCTFKLAQEIKKAKRIFISVSIDGINAETHEWVRGVRGSFKAAIKGLQNLVRVGLKPQIIMTLMNRNKNQAEGMVHLAESLGAGSLKFNIVQPTARGETMRNSGETLSIKELIEIGKQMEELSVSTKICLYYSSPVAFHSLSSLFNDKKDTCAKCDILRILGVLADGSYALCGIGQTVPKLVFGDAAKDKLENVWDNTLVLKELREGLPARLKGICSDCLMKYCCLGSCIAQNYYRSKDIWAPFWFCDEAHREGFFPKGRIIKQTQEDFNDEILKV